MKKVIHAAWNGRYLDGGKLCRVLLQYQNTPLVKNALSPAQKVFGHPMQDTLPAHTSSFTPVTQLQRDWAMTNHNNRSQLITIEMLTHSQTYTGTIPSSSTEP